MADLFNKHIKKATSRTKEKLLEGIGKSKATQDEVFDSHAVNLIKQSKSCEKLMKDVKNYAAALKTLCGAEKTLRDTVRESYETEWPEKEHLSAILDNLDIQTNELEKTVCDELVAAVQQYVAQFADLKKKVDKRGRKLVDYDHAKNSYNSTKTSSKKAESDPKVAKAFSELTNAEATYKEINDELIEILPATYDSRITFLVDTLQSMFNSQSIYQTESSKMNKQIVSQLDKLGQSMDYLRVARPEPRSLTPIDTPDVDSLSLNSSHSPMPAPTTPTPPVAVTPSSTPTSGNTLQTPKTLPQTASTPSMSSNPFDDEEEAPKADVEEKMENKVYPKLTSAPPSAEKAAKAKEENNKHDKQDKQDKADKQDMDSTNPFDESEDEHPAAVATKEAEDKHAGRKVLYTVISTHEYDAADSDELDLKPGDEIKVLESSGEDQLDEGWKLGQLQNGTIGVFPENFTKKQ